MPPTLEQRTLNLDPNAARLFYNHSVCKKKGLFGCKEWGIETEYYDLEDPDVRKKLINTGFVVVVESKQIKP